MFDEAITLASRSTAGRSQFSGEGVRPLFLCLKPSISGGPLNELRAYVQRIVISWYKLLSSCESNVNV